MNKLILTFLFLFMLVFTGQAKRVVRVVALGPTTPVIDLNMPYEQMVDTMMGFWDSKISEVLSYRPDLIVLPEACDRPDKLQQNWKAEKKYYEIRKDQFLDHFREIARNNHCYMVYSYKRILGDGTMRNSSVLIDRQGSVTGIYDKNYPTIGEMDRGIVRGIEAPVFKTDFGTVGMLICFDLNFDELRKKYAKVQPDILIFSSRYEGLLMQKFWAHSCRSFFVSAIEGLPFLPSEIIDPLGEVLNQSNSHYLNFAYAEINLDNKLIHRDNTMDKMMALKKKYGDEVSIKDPGLLDVVLLSSYSDSLTVDDMIKEFDIETFDSYYQRSSDYRFEPGNMEK